MSRWGALEQAISRRAFGAALGAAVVAPGTTAGMLHQARPHHAEPSRQATSDVAWPVSGPSRGRLWVQLPNHGGAGRLAPDAFQMFSTRIDEWAEARRFIDVWVLRMTSLLGRDAPVSDAFLGDALLPRLNDWSIELAVNVTGATLAGCGDGRRPANETAALQRLIDLGGRVSYLSLQSPLSKAGGRECRAYGREAGFDRRIADIVHYAALMAERFPEIQIGLVDAMPAKGWAYPAVYHDLVAALAATGIALAFLHLDCPAEAATPDWTNAREAEAFVRGELGVPFGLLYVSRDGGAASNAAFRDAVLAAYHAFRAAGGRPDHLVLTSWYQFPDANLPEDDEAAAPFMNLVRDFCRLGGVETRPVSAASDTTGGATR